MEKKERDRDRDREGEKEIERERREMEPCKEPCRVDGHTSCAPACEKRSYCNTMQYDALIPGW